VTVLEKPVLALLIVIVSPALARPAMAPDVLDCACTPMLTQAYKATLRVVFVSGETRRRTFVFVVPIALSPGVVDFSDFASSRGWPAESNAIFTKNNL
jgi:hypothetical protein